jgi:DNA-binding HxlR family transcriptional regulator
MRTPRELIYAGHYYGKHNRVPYKRTFNDRVKHPEMGLCHVIAGLAGHYFKTWSHPNQEKLCELLKRFGHRSMSVRTLNRHLAALEQDGFIVRTRRHEYVKGKGVVLRSTLYKMRAAFFEMVSKVVKAHARWQEMLKKNRGKSPAEALSGVHLPHSAQHRNPSFKGYRSRK